MSMQSRSEELIQFKKIDLVEYAISRGFEFDRRASSRSSVVVRHPCGDKLIIGKTKDGSFHYFNAKGSDSGTIIDLVQSLDGGTLGDIRKTLRRYSPTGLANRDIGRKAKLAPRAVNLAAVEASWRQAAPLTGRNSFLSDCRKIDPSIYLHPRFTGRLRVDHRGNVLAAHHNKSGLSGFEMKNGTKERTTFTGFSPGGAKGLFASRCRPDDMIMVITETFIDALSVAAITGGDGMRFFSLAGRPSQAQIKLLQAAASRMPTGSSIELRIDNDRGGHQIAKLLSTVLATHKHVARITTCQPRDPETDWNDELIASI
ncbi:MAG: toprim domain-containing protein [Planctomycetota bacterium]